MLYNTTLQYNTLQCMQQYRVVFLQSNNTTYTTQPRQGIDKQWQHRAERRRPWVVVVLTRRRCCTIQHRIQRVLYRPLVKAFIITRCIVFQDTKYPKIQYNTYNKPRAATLHDTTNPLDNDMLGVV